MIPSARRQIMYVTILHLLLLASIQKIYCFTPNRIVNNTALVTGEHDYNNQQRSTNSSNGTRDNSVYNGDELTINCDLCNPKEVMKLNTLANRSTDFFITINNTIWNISDSSAEYVGQAVTNFTKEVEDSVQYLNNTISCLAEYFGKDNLTLQDAQKERCTILRKKYNESMNDINTLLDIMQAFNQTSNITAKYYGIHESINRLVEDTSCNPCKFYVTEDTLSRREEIETQIDNLLHQAEHLQNSIKERNLKKISERNFTISWNVLDQYNKILENVISKITSLRTINEKRMEDGKFVRLFEKYVNPLVQCLIFIFGFAGNTLLLFIFARHKEVRTTDNLMLMNLAFVDCLNLIVYICQIYVSFTSKSSYTLCIVFRYFIQLCIGVSVYSVVVLSYQRFTNVKKSQTQLWLKHKVMKNSVYFLLPFIWVTSAVIATIETVYVRMDDSCNNNSQYRFSVVKLLGTCIIPLILVGFLSILSAKRLRESVRNMRDIRPGVDLVINSRKIGSRLILLLTFVFAISYVPLYLFLFLQTTMNIQKEGTWRYIIIFVTYSLSLCNSCFNPVALYIGSEKFRCYFQKYLCQKRNNVEIRTSFPTTIFQVTTGSPN